MTKFYYSGNIIAASIWHPHLNKLLLLYIFMNLKIDTCNVPPQLAEHKIFDTPI